MNKTLSGEQYIADRIKLIRPTWAEVDLSTIKENFNQIKRILSGDIKIMAVVKANAYGHGIVEVSRVLEAEGVDYFGVASVDEALSLRDSGIKTPILVLGAVLEDEIEPAIESNITLTICDYNILSFLDKIANSLGKIALVHIKVDTGMGRIGVWHDEAKDFILAVLRYKNIGIEGIYTHFSSAGRDRFFTSYQLDSFLRLLNGLTDIGIRIKLKHAANSIATVGLQLSHFNMVRPGIIIYGMYPKRDLNRLIDLKPALCLKTKIVYIKNVPIGRSISYGRTFITERPTKVATIPIGYADGYGRILSNKAQALVRGKRCRVIGKITMDQTMLDVTDVDGVDIGDEVVLIGKQFQEQITAEELARLGGTIPYELICSISARVPRIYV